MLKKIIALALVAALLMIALAACGEDSEKDKEDKESESGTEEAPSASQTNGPPPTEKDTAPKKSYDEIDFVDFHNGSHFSVSLTNPVAVAAAKFSVDFTIDGITLYMPTWVDDTTNYAVLKLYKWNSDYASTISGPALAEARKEDLTNNETAVFDIENEELAAGTYLWIVSEAECSTSGGHVGLWCLNEGEEWLGESEGVEFFHNGEPTTHYKYKFKVSGYVWR